MDPNECDNAGMRPCPHVLFLLTACAARAPLAPSVAAPAPPHRVDLPRLVAGVPAVAGGVLLVSSPTGLLDLLAAWPFNDASAAELAADLDGFLVERTGLRLRNVKSAAVFVLPDGGVAAVVHDAGGQARGPLAESYQETSLFSIGDGVVVGLAGNELLVGVSPAVKAGLDVIAGRQPGLATRPDTMRFLAEEASESFLTVAVEVNSLRAAGLTLPPIGLDRGVAVITRGGFRAVMKGPEAGLPGIVDQINSLLAVFTKAAIDQREELLRTRGVAEGLGAIYASHYARRLAAEIAPKRQGDRIVMELGFNTAQPIVTVAVVGIVAAVAIPAFMKNAHNAKAAASLP